MKDVKLNNNTKIISTVSLNNQCSRPEISPIDPMRQQSMEPVEFGNTARDVILYKKVKELAIAVENKQDKFDFIEIIEPSGKLDLDIIAKLIDNKFIEFEYGGSFYHLSSADEETLVYQALTADLNLLKTITVNVATGDYLAIEQSNEVLDNHIADQVIHVSQADRDRWDAKQPVVEFITITDFPEGTLSEEDLDLLKNSLVNQILFQSSIYRLSLKEGDLKKYFTSSRVTVYNEIDVDLETGHYIILNTLDPALITHMNDDSRHVTESDRYFWNNKVTAKVDPEESGIITDNYILTLTKH